MQSIKAFLAAFTLITANITPALAEAKVEILGASYGGSGCPEQSASVNVSPDGQELSILFDKFIATGNNSSQSRKSCNLIFRLKFLKAFKFLYTMRIIGVMFPLPLRAI